MKSRPTIFLSGVSHEFGTFRDAVENEIEMKGCFAENQPGFPPDYRTVEEMLTRRIRESNAVIHIVGFRFGAEPNQRPADVPRRSYTQMEFDIARRLGKPVYVFLSASEKIRDKPKTKLPPEDEEAQGLQFAHRDAVQQTNSLYYFFNDKAELCKRVAEIPPVAAAGFQADISRIDRYAPALLIGRDDELKLLSDAWSKVRLAAVPKSNVITIVALGGEGKTSLVAKWTAALAADNWPGCDAAFAWSFYSQGTREQSAASSDLFLSAALTFFGDLATANSAIPAWDKGKRLAELAGERRALLILDGLEPLQYPPTSPLAGQLKDQGVTALLKGLAARNAGLCVVTTRYSVTDLKNFWQTTASEMKLLCLSKVAGVELLKSLGVRGTRVEYEALVHDVKGHALTLNLLGKFLHDAHAGDIRQRGLVQFEEADNEEQGGHAFRAMDAYVAWFKSYYENRPLTAILRVLGLFDRPADEKCLAALRKTPAISGLTEPLIELAEAKWNLALTRLEEAKLLTVNRDKAGALLAIDAHPLLREYFAHQLRTQYPDACRAAHQRLYEHLCAATTDRPQPTLEDLQPLYQAVGHGCQAGLEKQVLHDVYVPRILRGTGMGTGGFYSSNQLGAFGADLGAVACFFTRPWRQVSPRLTPADQAWLLNASAFCLRALGRLTEAIEPMRAGLEMRVKQENWDNAAKSANNLSELELTLGEVAGAVRNAEQSVAYADRSGARAQQMTKRASLADALHQAGRRTEAEVCFRQAEKMQAEDQPNCPLLYSLRGFVYCDLILAASERAAWQCCVSFQPASSGGILPSAQPAAGQMPDGPEVRMAALQESCCSVKQRATQTLPIAARNKWLFSIALDHLTLGRSALTLVLLETDSLSGNPSSTVPSHFDPSSSAFTRARTHLTVAVDGLRRAGMQDHISRGLLARAWYSCVEATARRQIGDLASAAVCEVHAQTDLDDAWEIAERGPMQLFLADIHLHRARLFHAASPYPWATDDTGNPRGPRDDLAAARKLIEKCGYWRRKEELEDAETAARHWPA